MFITIWCWSKLHCKSAIAVILSFICFTLACTVLSSLLFFFKWGVKEHKYEGRTENFSRYPCAPVRRWSCLKVPLQFSNRAGKTRNNGDNLFCLIICARIHFLSTPLLNSFLLGNLYIGVRGPFQLGEMRQLFPKIFKHFSFGEADESFFLTLAAMKLRHAETCSWWLIFIEYKIYNIIWCLCPKIKNIFHPSSHQAPPACLWIYIIIVL